MCLFVVDVGSVGLMWLFAQHASIHCRSYIFTQVQYDYYRRFVFVVVLFTVFVHPRGLLGCRK